VSRGSRRDVVQWFGQHSSTPQDGNHVPQAPHLHRRRHPRGHGARAGRRRRSDGSIQAGVAIDGVSHSIGSVRKSAPIYTGASEVKGHSIATSDGKGHVTRKGARIGRSFTVRFFTRDGQSVTKKLVLRAERKGDDAGKPLVY